MSKIFVTGAKGFIGRHLVPKLESLGHSVFTDQIYWAQGFDVIIHLAAVTHIQNIFDPKMVEANFILTNEVFKRPERIIYASSCSAQHFTNPYAMSKQWAEYLGKKHGNALGLRFFNVYGPGNNKGVVKYLIDQPDGARINVRGPELVRDYIHVDDVVKEIMEDVEWNWRPKENKPPTSGPRVYAKWSREKNIGRKNVGTGIGTETMDLVNLYMKLSGKKFIIDVSEAGSNEPPSMVADHGIAGAISLHDGLLKTING